MTDVISTADKLACAERELKYRQHLFPRWIAAGKISAGKAAHELACMSAIVADYKVLAEKERLI
jgi:hypothetical protein